MGHFVGIDGMLVLGSVARKKRPQKRLNTLDVSIVGEGVTPGSVPVRALAELLQAAASAVEAVAKSKGMEVPALHLTQVKAGSAAYVLQSESEQAGAVIVDLYDHAKTRGKSATPQVRHALKRFQQDAGRIGSLRISAKPSHQGRARKPITVASPVEDDEGLEAYDEVYGRVVGLHVQRDGNGIDIEIRIEEGRTEEFRGDDSLMQSARDLFNQYVRAHVVYADAGTTLKPMKIERIVPWTRSGGDFLAAADRFREELRAEGIEFDASQFLRHLHSDD